MSAADLTTATKTLIARMYAAFNGRDVDAALAAMSQDVSWPKASEGGRVSGREEVRAYWTRQWEEFDPHVEPIEVLPREADKVAVRVHQLVRRRDGGDLLSDSEVWHVYTVRNGLITRMDLGDDEANASPSTAFASH